MQHSPGHLFITFTFIGLSGFGGVLPWARRTLVEQKKWLSAPEFNALLGVCQLVPGPNIVNLAVCVGQRFGGLRGAFAAVGGLMIAPMTVVILLALLYDHYGQFEQVQGMLRGISAVGVGLIAATGWAATCSAIFSSSLCSSSASNIFLHPIFPKDLPSSESPKSL